MVKTQTTYPSTIMKISCPNCGATGKVKTDSPPEKDFMVLCPSCKEKFLVKINKRNYYRKKTEIPVKCFLPAVNPDNREDLGKGFITDISMTGMSVKVYKRLFFSSPFFRKGKLLTFLFSLPPKNEKLEINGQIVRFTKEQNRPYFNIGVTFYKLSKFAEKQIGFFLLP